MKGGTFNDKKLLAGAKLLLEGMGVDLQNDANFKRTPQRVAALYREILSPRRRMREREVTFPARYDGMITLRGHRVFGLCPHHLLPIEYSVDVSYVPEKKVLGLSKLARVVEAVLTKPMMQEELTDGICYKLYQITEPKGCGARVTGIHGCMKYRGVKTDATAITMTLRGVYFTNAPTREEFLLTINGGGA